VGTHDVPPGQAGVARPADGGEPLDPYPLSDFEVMMVMMMAIIIIIIVRVVVVTTKGDDDAYSLVPAYLPWDCGREVRPLVEHYTVVAGADARVRDLH